MENSYYAITDNITDIIFLFRSFQCTLFLSMIQKSLFSNIYHITRLKISKCTSKINFDKFINLRKFKCTERIHANLVNQIANLAKLEDLSICYHTHGIVKLINFQKLNKLTSFNIFLVHSMRPDPGQQLIDTIFLMEDINLQKLSLGYCVHEKIITLINCPNLTYLSMSGWLSKYSKTFKIKYDNLLTNLQKLYIIDAKFESFIPNDQKVFNIHLSFEKLTYLHIAWHREDLRLIHLNNLRFLSIRGLEYDLIIGNLTNLTCMNLSYCSQGINIYNLNNLKKVILDECNINQEQTLKLFQMEKITDLNIDKFQHHAKVKERMNWFHQEKIVLHNYCIESQLLQFNTFNFD